MCVCDVMINSTLSLLIVFVQPNEQLKQVNKNSNSQLLKIEALEKGENTIKVTLCKQKTSRPS